MMTASSFFGLFRIRLLLLVLVSVTPALGLVFLSNFQQRRAEKARVCEGALAISKLAAAAHQNFIENTRQLLGTLTQQAPFVLLTTNRAFGEQNLGNLRKLSPDYLTFGLIETNGFLFCGADPTNTPVYLGDRPYFQRVMSTKRFSYGDFQISRLTGKPSLDFGYPVLDEKGELKRVLFAALKLSRLTEVVKQIRLPPGGTIIAIDRNGIVMARYPEPEKWVGRSLAGTAMAHQMLTQKEGIFEMPGLDGVPQLHALTALTDGRSPALYISVGIPLLVCFAPANQALAEISKKKMKLCRVRQPLILVNTSALMCCLEVCQN